MTVSKDYRDHPILLSHRTTDLGHKVAFLTGGGRLWVPTVWEDFEGLTMVPKCGIPLWIGGWGGKSYVGRWLGERGSCLVKTNVGVWFVGTKFRANKLIPKRVRGDVIVVPGKEIRESIRAGDITLLTLWTPVAGKGEK